jgi:toxin ParE1/3/4
VSLRLRWTEQAVSQLGAIAEYIGLSSPVYAEQVVARITARLQQAIEHPQSGRVVQEFDRPDVRELIETPYRVIYRPTGNAIEVLAVVHGRRNLQAEDLG